jgi:hypothetical protein
MPPTTLNDIFNHGRIKVLVGPWDFMLIFSKAPYNKALHSELLTKNFAISKIPFFSEKFPNFDSWTFPKLAKTKSSENSV